MTALFIGRFQPFHMGHLQVVVKAIQENGNLIIGIGSSDENYRQANPFTCAERIQMIEAALDEAAVPRDKYTIIPIPNINNFGLWAQHVELYIPNFNKIYTGSPIVMKLFNDYNKKLSQPYQIIPIEKEIKISATEIREKMVKNRKWENFVPESVAKLITQWQGPERLMTVQEEQK